MRAEIHNPERQTLGSRVRCIPHMVVGWLAALGARGYDESPSANAPSIEAPPPDRVVRSASGQRTREEREEFHNRLAETPEVTEALREGDSVYEKHLKRESERPSVSRTVRSVGDRKV